MSTRAFIAVLCFIPSVASTGCGRAKATPLSDTAPTEPPVSAPDALRASDTAAVPNVTIAGMTKECFMKSMVPVGGVTIGAFAGASAKPVVDQLEEMEKFSGFATHDSLAFQKYDAMETRLQTLVLTKDALTRVTSAADGTFTLKFAPVDSVLVVGFANREDEMYYFTHTYISGRADTSFVLEMSSGACDPPKG